MNRRAKIKFNQDLKTKINDLSNLLENSGLLSAPVKIWFSILCQKFKIDRKKINLEKKYETKEIRNRKI